jgi:hypothetical protein
VATLPREPLIEIGELIEDASPDLYECWAAAVTPALDRCFI